jgi:hypothetical protein
MTSVVRLMLQQTTCGSRQGKNIRVEKYRRQFKFYERGGGFETSTKQTSTRVGLMECFLFVLKITANTSKSFCVIHKKMPV